MPAEPADAAAEAPAPEREAGVEYVEVLDERDGAGPGCSACYTRVLLKSALQLAGCKTKVAHKAAKAVFRQLSEADSPEPRETDAAAHPAEQRTVRLQRAAFERCVRAAISQLTDKPAPDTDVRIACSIRERRRSVVILLAGTSGTGKSTLASLLAAKMGITTVVSTDSVRHMLRSFSSAEQDPLLWASTYQAGEVMGPLATDAHASPRQAAKIRTIKGYKAQCAPVLARVAALVAACEARRESLVVEGAHLSINAAFRIAAAHPTVAPFLVCIHNEAKHRERFAVRAKYMTLDPGVNRYVRHFAQIRTIQAYLQRRAARHALPAVNNTNVDRSVAALHATVLAFLRRRAAGAPVLDPAAKTAVPLLEDYGRCLADAWSSKSMLQLIRSRKHRPPADPEGAFGSAQELQPGPAAQPASATPGAAAAAADALLQPAAAAGAGARSSGDGTEAAARAELPLEGASVAETELEELDDGEPSQDGSGRGGAGTSPARGGRRRS